MSLEEPIIKPLRMRLDVDLEYAFAANDLARVEYLLLNVLLKTPRYKVLSPSWQDPIPEVFHHGDPLPELHLQKTDKNGKKFLTMFSSMEEFRRLKSEEQSTIFCVLDFFMEAKNEEDVEGVIINPGSEVKMFLPQKHLLHLMKHYEELKQKGRKSADKPKEKHYEKLNQDEITMPEAILIAQSKAEELGAKLNPTMTVCADGWACYFHDKNGRGIYDAVQHFITLTGKYMDVQKDIVHISGIFANIKDYIKDIKAGKDIVGKKSKHRWDEWNEANGYRISQEIDLPKATEIAVKWAACSYFAGKEMRVAPLCVRVPDGWYFKILPINEAPENACGCFVMKHGLRLIPESLENIPYSKEEQTVLDIHEFVDVLQEKCDAKKKEEETEKFLELIRLARQDDVDEEELVKRYYELPNPTYKVINLDMDGITVEMETWLFVNFDLCFEDIASLSDKDYEILLDDINRMKEIEKEKFLISDIINKIKDIRAQAISR